MRTEIWQPESRPTPVGPEAVWDLSVRRALPAPMDDVWQRLHSEWLPQWLGVDSVPQMVGSALRHGEEVRGRVTGCHAGRRLRVRWTAAALDHETDLQVTLLDAALLDGVPSGTVVEIRQERLLGPAERMGMLEHWTAVLDGLATSIAREHGTVPDLRG